ncbi:NUDIX hydrolase [Roseibium aggregatum]|uniref:NUDIX hydrolase n=1 Tax=Roseibium aggregatum TaxID=187304 RepID=UPI002E35018A|nr:NUDIX hydrolase [Roseibium aggregatum]
MSTQRTSRHEDRDHWSLVESSKVFEACGRLRVLRQTVCLPDNRLVDDYYQIDLPSFASVYAVTEDDRVLLLRQYKHGIGRVCLTLPGGQVDPGEDAEFSARRELLEETGYGGGRWLAGPTLVLHGNQRIASAHIFVARHVIKLADANSGDLEDATLIKLPREQVRQAALGGDLPVISHVATVGVAEMLLAG